MNRVTHFDLTSSNPEKAAEFYNRVFGWKFKSWSGDGMDYWMINTGRGNGINGGLSRKDKAMGPAITIEVKSLKNTLEKIEQMGGRVTSEIMPITGIGWFATFEDKDKNAFGLMQSDKKAKQM